MNFVLFVFVCLVFTEPKDSETRGFGKVLWSLIIERFLIEWRLLVPSNFW